MVKQEIKCWCQECGEECEYDNSELCGECEDEHFMAGEIKCSVCADIASQIIMGVYLCKDCDLDDYHSNIRYG